MQFPDTHLDLGCGTRPRNPYQRKQLYGVDIRELPSDLGFVARAANLAVQPIPFDTDQFGSVSAFDFIEHVPRMLPTADGSGTRLPFIDLMNEIWRVLAPGGRLFAVTPAWPRAEAFVDPTHVNFITERTHRYFCGDEPLGRMYGFEGGFRELRVMWVHHHPDAFVSDAGPELKPANGGSGDRMVVPLHRHLARGVRDGLRVLRGKQPPVHTDLPGSHLLWELEAVKPT